MNVFLIVFIYVSIQNPSQQAIFRFSWFKLVDILSASGGLK